MQQQLKELVQHQYRELHGVEWPEVAVNVLTIIGVIAFTLVVGGAIAIAIYSTMV